MITCVGGLCGDIKLLSFRWWARGHIWRQSKDCRHTRGFTEKVPGRGPERTEASRKREERDDGRGELRDG